MNEQLLKMNGLSVEILDSLSFESYLGIPLKKNLHYFDKDLLSAELVSMMNVTIRITRRARCLMIF